MKSILEFFASSEHPNSLGAKFRAKRLLHFENLLLPLLKTKKTFRILDVGGTDYFWKGSRIPTIPGVNIFLLNLHLEPTSHPQIKSLTGDATQMDEFENQSFDLVFSNSVIEHLYTLENQEKMAKEIIRIGERYFIQTPNKYFPIEAHYALPFAQFLPKNLVYHILTKTPLSRLKRWEKKEASQSLKEIRLLNEQEMRSLFPSCQIFEEKVLGLTKSITAHNLV